MADQPQPSVSESDALSSGSPADLKMLNTLFKAAMATEAKLIAFGQSAACHPDHYPSVVHAASGWRIFADQLQDAAAAPNAMLSPDGMG